MIDYFTVAPGVTRENHCWGYFLEGRRSALIGAGFVAPSWLVDGSQKDRYGRTRRKLESEYGDFHIKSHQQGNSDVFRVAVRGRGNLCLSPGASLPLLRAPSKAFDAALSAVLAGEPMPDWKPPKPPRAAKNKGGKPSRNQSNDMAGLPPEVTRDRRRFGSYELSREVIEEATYTQLFFVWNSMSTADKFMVLRGGLLGMILFRARDGDAGAAS
jgi:hypothetical protein